MEIRDVLATNLRYYRRLRGFSQEELAHRAAIDRTYISLLERRKYSVSIDTLARIAAALDVPPEALLAGPQIR